MRDYIKREDAISILQNYIFERGFYCDADADKRYTAELVDILLTAAPAADVVERKVGRWEDVMFGWMCSCCGQNQEYSVLFRFCPNCGARMESDT